VPSRARRFVEHLGLELVSGGFRNCLWYYAFGKLILQAETGGDIAKSETKIPVSPVRFA